MGTAERPSPDDLLRRIQRHEGGRLKIFLGYASRVGKSNRMFEEGVRRRARGQDVVIGAVQMKGSQELENLISQFEVIQLKQGAIDVDALLRRSPEVCLVDELANRNPPGSRHEYRWEDVEEIRRAGINVVTAINLQYIGAGSVPESFIHEADELVIVDAPSGQHNDLREKALLLAAEVVEEQLQRCLDAQGLQQARGAQERILICITGRSNTRSMLESGARAASLFHGQLLALHVDTGEHDDAVSENLEYARRLGADVHVVAKDNSLEAIVQFAHEHRVTQIYIGHTQRPWWNFRKKSLVSRLIERAEGMDIRLFPPALSAA